RVDHELRDACAVAEVDEDKTAVIAPPRHPPGELELPADLVEPWLAAGEIAPRAHESASVRESTYASILSRGQVASLSPGVLIVAAWSAVAITVMSAPRRAAWVSCPLSERPA